jgi:hypothetical protein
MLLDGLADHFWKLAQLDRLDAAVKLSALKQANLDAGRREEQCQSYALDVTNSEMKKGGLVRQKDSAGKFRLILKTLEELMELAAGRKGSVVHKEMFKALYGTEDCNWRGEKMFSKFLQGSETDYAEVLEFLEDELDAYRRAEFRYRAEHREENVAEREARLVTCGGDAVIVFREIEVTDRLADRKLQLLLKVRAERFAREKEEGGQQQEGSGGQSTEGVSNNPTGDPESGSVDPPPRKPVQRGGRQGAKGKEPALGGVKGPKACPERSEGAKGKSEDHAPRRQKPVAGGEAVERRSSLVQGTSPGLEDRLPPFLFHPSGEDGPQEAEGERQSAAARLGNHITFDLRPSTFDFSKNKATDLPDNKGSASTEIRNKATVESCRQKAEGENGPLPEAAERRNNLAQGASPRIGGHPPLSFLPRMAEGGRQAAAARLGNHFTFDLQPSTFDFSKNKATDLLDNKGSAPAQIRNKATAEGGMPPADGSLPPAYYLLPLAFRQLPTVFCILAGEEPSALAGVQLRAGNRPRTIGPIRPTGPFQPVACAARGWRHSLHASGGKSPPANRADRTAVGPELASQASSQTGEDRIAIFKLFRPLHADVSLGSLGLGPCQSRPPAENTPEAWPSSPDGLPRRRRGSPR